MMDRPWHYIRDNKTSSVPERHIFVDTETSRVLIAEEKWEHKLKLGWGCYVNVRSKEGIRKEEWLPFDNSSVFWDWVEGICQEKTKTLIWAHNMGFDFAVLGGFKALYDRGWTLKLWIQDAQRVLIKYVKYYKDKNGIDIPYKNKAGNTFYKTQKSIMILDTLNYFKAPLYQVGIDMELPKGEIDFDTCSRTELSVYCHRDVEIIRKAILSLIGFIRDNDLGTFKPTIAGQAFNAFRHRFMPYKILIHNKVPAILLEREAYKGGRTEVFKLGQIDGTAYNLDVNSMYPYVMHTEVFPTKLVGYDNRPDAISLRHILNNYLVIAKVEVEISEPAIGMKSNRLIFPVGTFETTLTTPELNWVLEHGKINAVKEAAWYDYAPIFKSYVDFMYSKRREAIESGDKTNALFYKYMLNTLYGKFGQKNQNWAETGTEVNQGKEYSEDFFDYDKAIWRLIYHFGGRIWEREGYKEGYDSFVAIPAFVTAYARMYLWSLIKKAGYNTNVFYCDSDSLFTNKEGYNNLKPLLHPFKLGYFKLEDEGSLYIYNLKDYVFKDTRKIKGVKKDAEEIEPGVFKQSQMLKFRSSLKQGDINKVIERKVTKHLKRDYKKGEVVEDGWIKPFKLIDGLTQEEIAATEEKYRALLAKAMVRVDRNERRRGRELQKTDIYDEDPLLERDEKIEDALREAKRWIQ